jgi:hypothetical protein
MHNAGLRGALSGLDATDKKLVAVMVLGAVLMITCGIWYFAG